MVMQQQNTIRTPKFWYLIILIVAIVGLCACLYVGLVTARNTKASLLQRTQSLAYLTSADSIAALHGNDSDITNPAYQKLKNSFMNIQQTNTDVRFIYLLTLDKDNHSFFYVDSVDPGDEENYSPPGQLYPEGDQDVINAYQQKTGTILPITGDRWGQWLSAFSPVSDEHGKVVAILGMDVSATHYYRTIAVNMSIPFLITLFVISILFWIKRRVRFQQQYVSEKAFFLSFASHEIRSPLTAVFLALKKLPAHTRNEPTMQKVEDSLQHTLSIIDDVLSLQATEGLKSQGVHKKPTQIHGIIKDTINSLHLLADQRGIKVVDKTSHADLPLMVTIDPLLFERVISNFLVNAIKYSPENSVVEVAVSQAADTWQIQFHNEGDPIPEDEQKRLLRGFYRTKAARQSGQKGTGLGLVLVRDIINEHKGKLSLESAPGLGVTFIITIPR
jgi:signal transduction histidine kinase